MRTILIPILFAGIAAAPAAERINQEGRILGPVPTVSAPILFNTASADAVVAAMQIFPVTSAWNEDISGRPLLGGNNADPAPSNAMIAQIRDDVYTGLAGHAYANRQRMVVFQEMNYVLVPDNQANVGIDFVTYPGDSDYNGGTNPVATWPIPSNMPIESWPTGTGTLTLTQWQQDINNDGGDRHSIVVQPGAARTFETWEAILTANSPAWQASNGCIFDLSSNTMRPAGETSGDAAGLSLFPALVRYDEAERGYVEHAMRIVVKRSRQTYLYPATHQAGSTTMAQVPAMGQRVRLKSSFTIPASWSKEEKAIAYGLKKYGALVADNGGFFSISICPDDRWPSGCFDHFSTGAGSDFCDINNFEVVEGTGATGGPRSAGAPTASAGADQSVDIAAGANLAGGATGSGLTTTWYLYPLATAPGTVSFGNAASLSTTANFSAAGAYTLMLKVSDGVHAPAYDALVVTVTSGGTNPAPTLTSLSPSGATAGDAGFTMTLAGSNFLPSSQVSWTGHASLAAVTQSATQLTVAVPASYLTTAGSPSVTVVTPAPGGGTSSALPFVIAAAPVTGGTGGSGSGSGGGGHHCGFGMAAGLVMLAGFGLLRRPRSRNGLG